MAMFRDYNYDNEPCILCGKREFLVARQAFDKKLLRCKGCGLLFLNNIKEKELKKFYEYHYFNNNGSDLIGYKNYSKSCDAERLNFREFADLIETFQCKGGKILDVGCAKGDFVRIMQDRGWTANGIDPSEYALGQPDLQTDLNLQQGCIENYAGDTGEYDVVTLIGVLEHLERPAAGLVNINRLLKTNGLLLITTLDAGKYFHLFKFKPPEHIYYFARKQLSNLLAKHGFNVQKLVMYRRKYYFSEYLIKIISLFFPKISGVVESLFSRFPRLDFIASFPTNEILVIAKKRF